MSLSTFLSDQSDHETIQISKITISSEQHDNHILKHHAHPEKRRRYYYQQPNALNGREITVKMNNKISQTT